MHVAVAHNLDFAEDGDRPPSTDDIDYRANAEVAEVAACVSQALLAAGHIPVTVPVRDSTESLVAFVRAHAIDVVFNLVESLGGDARRESEVPRALRSAGIAYTGNRAAALTNAVHKDVVRELLGAHRVRVARGCTVMGPDALAVVRRARLRYPVFVKPAAADGSIGVSQASVVDSEAALLRQIERVSAVVAGPYVVEEYLPGPEINVSILPDGDETRLVPTTIDFGCVPSRLFPIVTYACKWDENSPEYAARTVPLGDLVSLPVRRDILRTAEAAFYVIGGSSYGRVDMRLDARGRPCVIDVNPNPDLHPDAGFAVALREANLPYVHLIDSIVSHASRGSRTVAPTIARARSGTARCAFAVG